MAAIPLNDAGVRNMKRALTSRFPEHKSSHLSEALAASLGFQTNIALATKLRDSNPDDPDYALLDEGRFLDRLATVVRRELTPSERSLVFDDMNYADLHQVVRTRSPGYRRVNYKGTRLRAWRNMLVAGVNAAIDRRLISVRPGDNRWQNLEIDAREKPKPHVFPFEIDGIPALCSIHDAGYDELSIHVAFWPTADSADWLPAAWIGFRAGDAFASGWLERRDGAWLQVSSDPLGRQFSCRQPRLEKIAALDIQPKGYADRGSFKM